MRLIRFAVLALLVVGVGLVVTSAQAGQDDYIGASGPVLPYIPDAVPRSDYDPKLAVNRNVRSERNKYSRRFLTIYSGSTSGSYYPVASSLCQVMEMTYHKHGIRCVALRSQGVASNVELMRQGRAQMIIIQSDTNLFAANNTMPIPGAQSVMSLHDEMGILVTTGDSGIRGPRDLAGKRVNIGEAGSAARGLWNDLLGAVQLGQADLGAVVAAPQSFNTDGICEDRIDAFGLWIGHPAPVIQYTLDHCSARVVSMWDDSILSLIKQKPYYYQQTLPAGTYRGQTRNLDAFGIKASLIAYQRLDPDIVYWFVRSIVENLETLKTLNPALANLSVDRMFSEGNFLRFHEGAARYWKERGMLKGDRIQTN